jgi:hypothetical protein
MFPLRCFQYVLYFFEMPRLHDHAAVGKLGVHCGLTGRNAILRSISLFDFKIHNLSSNQAMEDLDIRKVWYDTREESESMDFSLCRQEGADLVSFNHPTAGMDSGYYAYLR